MSNIFHWEKRNICVANVNARLSTNYTKPNWKYESIGIWNQIKRTLFITLNHIKHKLVLRNWLGLRLESVS